MTVISINPFHRRVYHWALRCFGAADATDKHMRNVRFLEEATELVQSLGLNSEEAHAIIDYVYGRPEGTPAQEVGGTLVTLAALCAAQGFDMELCGEVEYTRVMENIDKIQLRHANKPAFVRAPGKYLPPISVQPKEEILDNETIDRNYWTALKIGDHYNAVYVCTRMDDGGRGRVVGTKLIQFLINARIPE